MTLKLPASNVLKQILGGVAGMAVAIGIYYGVEYASSLRIQALLLTPDNPITEQIGTLRFSAKNVDPDTLARLTQRAKLLQARVNPTAQVAMRGSAVAANTVQTAPSPSSTTDAAAHPGAPLTEAQGGTQLPSSGITLMQVMLLSGLCSGMIALYGIRRRAIAAATVRV